MGSKSFATGSTERFMEELEHSYAQLPAHKLRQLAWQRFLTLGLPSREESYQYIPISQLYQEKATLSSPSELSQEEVNEKILPECHGRSLVFVNGRYEARLSSLTALPSSIVILPFSQALGPYSQFLQGRSIRSIEEENDPFTLLCHVFSEHGLFIYLPPKTKLDGPIQFLHFSQSAGLQASRTHLLLGQNAEAEVITTTHGKLSLSLGLLDVSLEEGAHLKRSLSLTPPEQAWHFESLRASLKKNSSLKQISFTYGAKTVRQDMQVKLLGENSSVQLKGLSQLHALEQSHVNICIEHIAPHTHSQQLFKQVLSGVSQGSFQGKILVQKEAQKTEAYQLSKSLILGSRAIANTKPGLEIFADDVKASHGATVSQIEESELFYLKTRGLSEETAKKLLITAFSGEILSELPSSLVERL